MIETPKKLASELIYEFPDGRKLYLVENYYITTDKSGNTVAHINIRKLLKLANKEPVKKHLAFGVGNDG